MRKLKIYLDTSIISFLFADDAPELKNVTEIFFKDFVEKNIFEVIILEVVITEIKKTKDDEKRNTLLNVLDKYDFLTIKLSDEISSLASSYIRKGMFSDKQTDDALHIAVAQ